MQRIQEPPTQTYRSTIKIPENVAWTPRNDKIDDPSNLTHGGRKTIFPTTVPSGTSTT